MVHKCRQILTFIFINRTTVCINVYLIKEIAKSIYYCCGMHVCVTADEVIISNKHIDCVENILSHQYLYNISLISMFLLCKMCMYTTECFDLGNNKNIHLRGRHLSVMFYILENIAKKILERFYKILDYG